MSRDLSGVTLLGNQNTKYKFDYDPDILERFKKHFEDSVEDEQVVNLDCFEFVSRCITGDTLIKTARNEDLYPDGVPIKDLVGTSGYVFCFDPETEQSECRRFHDVRKTGSNMPVVKITMSKKHNGVETSSYLRCTPDHMILVRVHWHTYRWIPASELEPGMHLVFSQDAYDTIRSRSKHRLIASAAFGVSLSDMSDQDVHHVDHNHQNNDPSNLQVLSKYDHYHHHRSVEYGYDESLDEDTLISQYESGLNINQLAKMYGCDSSTIRSRLEGSVTFRTQSESLKLRHSLENKERDSEICRLYAEGYTSYEIGDYVDLHETRILEILRDNNVPIRDSNQFAAWRKEHPLPALNHRVVSVEPDGFADVYNMEVEGLHNFFANDIVIHNCPKTGQPDLATIHISYIPNEYMVESKSLKLYLFSFQQHGDFHETCVHMIMDDLVKLLQPKYLEVFGDFNSRGGISILPLSIYADSDHLDMKKARQLSMMQYSAEHKPRTGG